MEQLIWLIQSLTPDFFNLDKTIREVIEEARQNFQDINRDAAKAAAAAASGGDIKAGLLASSEGMHRSAGEMFIFWWQIFMGSLLFVFFVSCISHFAQFYQLTLDQQESKRMRQRIPSSVRQELLSPGSGRLRLPPPSFSAVNSTSIGTEKTTQNDNALNSSANIKDT